MTKKSNAYYEILVEEEFSAAHFLRGYDQGRDEPVHGHTWKVQLEIRAPRLNRLGIAVDFIPIRNALRSVLKGLDHASLNDHPAFRHENPSAENVAQYFWNEVSPSVRKEGGLLTRVTVWEGPGCAASYVRGR